MAGAKTPLRVALVGVGGVGRVHLEAYQRAERVKVVAAVEPDPTRRDAIARTGLRAFANLDDMLLVGVVDIACVLTPPASHAAVTRRCAAAGVHVLCEKPLATSAEEAQSMIDACQRANVCLGYGASYRFLPAMARAKAMIEQGAIGELLLIREHVIGGSLRSTPTLSDEHYPAGTPGGGPMGLVDHGIHLIDALPWLANSPIVSVFGRGNVSGRDPRTEYLIATLAGGAVAALLYDERTFATELPNEGIFSFGASWDAEGYHAGGAWAAHPGSVHVHGTKGALRIFHYANALFCNDERGWRQIPLPDLVAPFHFAAQIDAFADDILAGRPPNCPGEDGLAALSILSAIYRSRAAGEVILVGDDRKVDA